MRKRRVVILGATGSIGTSARKVARDIPDRMEIVGMSAHSSEEALREARKEFPNAKLAVSSGDGGASAKRPAWGDWRQSPRVGRLADALTRQDLARRQLGTNPASNVA